MNSMLTFTLAWAEDQSPVSFLTKKKKTPNKLNKSYENTQPQLELCSAGANDSTVMTQRIDARGREIKRQKETGRCKELF